LQIAIKAGTNPKPLVKDAALRLLQEDVRLQSGRRSVKYQWESLVQFLQQSPLAGVEIDLQRDKDTGRDIDL